MPVSLQALVTDTQRLLSLPDVVVRVNQLTDDPNSSISDIEKVIRQDAGLSTHLLNIVNSPFYGFPSSIDSISRAIMIIGSQDLRNLTLASSATKMLNGLQNKLLDMRHFWQHNLYCAIIARELGRQNEDIHPERLFVAGLLHEIGRLVLYSAEPEACAELVEQANREKRPLFELEQETFGFSHNELGAELGRKWLLPKSLTETIRHFHDPSQADTRYQYDAAMINIADATACNLDKESNLCGFTKPINSEIWNMTNLTPEQVGQILPEIRNRFLEMRALLFPDKAVA